MYDIAAPETAVKELCDHIASLKEHDWEAPRIVPDAISPARPKYDVFISVPMTSVRASQYPQLRSNVLLLAEELKKDNSFERVYTAVERITRISNVEPSAIAARKDLEALERSRDFVLIYPTGARSSSLVEAGYALALRKPSVYLFRRDADLPFMLRKAAEAHKWVHMLQYQGDRLTEQAEHIHTFLARQGRDRK